MALIAASVPEFTMRIFSIDGIKSQILLAICVSISVGAPKLSPHFAASLTALTISG